MQTLKQSKQGYYNGFQNGRFKNLMIFDFSGVHREVVRRVGGARALTSSVQLNRSRSQSRRWIDRIRSCQRINRFRRFRRIDRIRSCQRIHRSWKRRLCRL